MSVLTPEQESQLAAAMHELGRLTTSGLIYEAARLRLPDHPNESDKTRFRKGYAGAVAAVKIMAYAKLVRIANLERLRIGRLTFDLDQQSRELALIDPIGAIAPEVEAPLLAGMQEVQIHIFAVAIYRLRQLLPVALRAAGFKLDLADRLILDAFEPLRHYYEHIEQQLPGGGGDYEKQAVTEIDDPWSIAFQLPMDATGRVLLDGKQIEVDSVGAQKVQDIVTRTWQRITKSALAEMDKFYRNNPDRIPHPSRVDSGWEIKIGGTLASRTTFRPGKDDLSYEQVAGLWVRVPPV